MVRIAKPEDLEALIPLLISLFTQEVEFQPNRALHEKALAEILADERIGHIFVAENEGKIVGMVSALYTVSTALGSQVALIEDMVVDQAYRGKQLGSELLSFALDFIKQRGCLRATLLTDSDNMGAQKFYARHGFEISSMVPLRKRL